MKKREPSPTKPRDEAKSPADVAPVGDQREPDLFGSMRGLVLRGGGEELLDPIDIPEPSDPFLDREPV